VRKLLLTAIPLFLIAIIGGKLYLDNQSETTPVTSQTNQNAVSETKTPADTKSRFTQQTFQNIKSAHFVSSEPANNALLTAPISEIKLTFDFDLASAGSKISVMSGGIEVTTGASQVIGDSLVLSVPVKTDETGNYEVSYSACWFDGSCHDGDFGFSVQLP